MDFSHLHDGDVKRETLNASKNDPAKLRAQITKLNTEIALQKDKFEKYLQEATLLASIQIKEIQKRLMKADDSNIGSMISADVALKTQKEHDLTLSRLKRNKGNTRSMSSLPKKKFSLSSTLNWGSLGPIKEENCHCLVLPVWNKKGKELEMGKEKELRVATDARSQIRNLMGIDIALESMDREDCLIKWVERQFLSMSEWFMKQNENFKEKLNGASVIDSLFQKNKRLEIQLRESGAKMEAMSDLLKQYQEALGSATRQFKQESVFLEEKNINLVKVSGEVKKNEKKKESITERKNEKPMTIVENQKQLAKIVPILVKKQVGRCNSAREHKKNEREPVKKSFFSVRCHGKDKNICLTIVQEKSEAKQVENIGQKAIKNDQNEAKNDFNIEKNDTKLAQQKVHKSFSIQENRVSFIENSSSHKGKSLSKEGNTDSKEEKSTTIIEKNEMVLKKYKKLKMRCRQLLGERKKLYEMIGLLEQDTDEAEKEMDRLHSKLKKRKCDLVVLQGDIKSQQGIIEDQKNKLKQNVIEIENKKKLLDAFEKDNSRLRATVEGIIHEKEAMRGALSEKRKKELIVEHSVNTLRMKNHQVIYEKDAMGMEISDLKDRLRNVVDELKVKEEEVVKLEELCAKSNKNKEFISRKEARISLWEAIKSLNPKKMPGKNEKQQFSFVSEKNKRQVMENDKRILREIKSFGNIQEENRTKKISFVSKDTEKKAQSTSLKNINQGSKTNENVPETRRRGLDRRILESRQELTLEKKTSEKFLSAKKENQQNVETPSLRRNHFDKENIGNNFGSAAKNIKPFETKMERPSKLPFELYENEENLLSEDFEIMMQRLPMVTPDFDQFCMK